MQRHKELVEFQQKNNDLPVDWPFCTYNPANYHGPMPLGVWGGMNCLEIAAWAIQLDYNNPESEVALLCTHHFTQLPQKPDGSCYRIFTLTIRNYQKFLKK